MPTKAAPSPYYVISRPKHRATFFGHVHARWGRHKCLNVCQPRRTIATAPTHSFARTSLGIIPSFMAYSSFDTSNRNLYAVMVVLTTTVQVISATVKWIREDKVRWVRGYTTRNTQAVPAFRTLLRRIVMIEPSLFLPHFMPNTPMSRARSRRHAACFWLIIRSSTLAPPGNFTCKRSGRRACIRYSARSFQPGKAVSTLTRSRWPGKKWKLCLVF